MVDGHCIRASIVVMLTLLLAACGGGGGSNNIPRPPETKVDRVFPGRGSETALVNTDIRATFGQDMDAATITASTFTLEDGGRNPVPAAVSYDADTLTAVLDPLDDLDPEATYRATLSDAIGSALGVSLNGDFVWNFVTAPAVSVISTDDNGDLSSTAGSTFADTDSQGRLVVFESDALDLVPDDSNGLRDIFVKDTVTGLILRANTTVLGEQALTGASFAASVSADGRYVAFESLATDLVDGGTNGIRQVFRKDLTHGFVRVVSQSVARDQGDAASVGSVLSADGRYVAFASLATNLISRGSNGQRQIYVKDMDTGVVRLVSRDLDGNPANVPAGSVPAISGDGRLVVFESLARDLVPGGTNGLRQVYITDLDTARVRLVSSTAVGQQATGGASSAPDISADGRFVAFESLATNLIPGGSNGRRQIFVKNLDSRLVRLVSVSFSGDQANGASAAPNVSADGRFVAFSTLARNLLPAGTNAFRQVLVKDLDSGRVTLVSTDKEGVQGNNTSDLPVLSAAGTYVVFQSLADNLVANDDNIFTEIFRSLNRLTQPPVITP